MKTITSSHNIHRITDLIGYNPMVENEEPLVFQGDPIELSQKLIKQKYFLSFCPAFEDPINSILRNDKVSSVILYKDNIYFDDQSEYLKRYYQEDESYRKLQNILQLYFEYQKPNLILHSQNTIIGRWYKQDKPRLIPQQLVESPKAACDELHSLNFEHSSQENDLGPLNSFSNEKDLFGGGSNDTDDDAGTEPKMFASVLDDGQVHNSFQKLLERYEEMDNMSFESNQYNIYSPDRSTQNSPKKSISPPRVSHMIIGDIEDNKQSEVEELFIEEFNLEEELDSEEKRVRAKEVKDYFESEEFDIRYENFELIGGSPREDAPDDIIHLMKKQSSTNKSTNETKEINKSKTSPPSMSHLKTQPSIPEKKELFAKKTSAETILPKHKSPTVMSNKLDLKSPVTKKQIKSELENFKKHLKNVEANAPGKHSSPKQGPYFLSMKKSPGSENTNSESTLPSKCQNQSARREISYLNTVEDNTASKLKLMQGAHMIRNHTQNSPTNKGIADFYRDKYNKTEQNERVKVFNKTNSNIQEKPSIYIGQTRKSSLESPKKSFLASNIFAKLSGEKNQILETQKKIKEICNNVQPPIKSKKKNLKSTQVNSLATQESECKNFNLTQPIKTESFALASQLRINEFSSCKEAFYQSLKQKHSGIQHPYAQHIPTSPGNRAKSHATHSSLDIKVQNLNNLKDTIGSLINNKPLTSKQYSRPMESPPPMMNNKRRESSGGSNKGARANSKKAKRKKPLTKPKVSLDGKQSLSMKKSFEFKLDLATLNKLISSNPPGSKNKTTGGFFSGKIVTGPETGTDLKTTSNRYSKVLSENRQKSAKLKGNY